MEWQDFNNEAKSLLANNQIHKAKEVVQEGLGIFPNQLNLIITANDILRNFDRSLSLQYAQIIIQYHPDYFDGYARTAQDLNYLGRHAEAIQVIDAGLERFPQHKWILFTSLIVYSSAGRYREAALFGQELIRLYPDFTPAYQPYMICISHIECDDTKVEVFIEALKLMPASIDLIRLKLDLLLRFKKYEEYRRNLYVLIKQLPQFMDEFLLRLYRIESFKDPPSHFQADNSNCDVICIASDEAPYITEFIHHYLYLGFENIFIGINNSGDKTESILRKIQSEYRNVHVLNVDLLQAQYFQDGCYSFLFAYARRQSKARYCLFVDVDEFWVADPFPMKIHEFIANKAPFDVYSFQWVCCYGENLFSPPLSAGLSFRWNSHVKSICCYGSEYICLQIHAPILAYSKQVRVRLGHSINKNIDEVFAGISVQQITSNPNLSATGIAGQAWVFHRIQRSEIEYSFRLFKVHANNSTAVETFKTNRWGFDDIRSMSVEDADYYGRVLPEDAIVSYHNSLEEFTERCDVSGDIDSARSLISEECILEKLKGMPSDILARNAHIAKQIFSGTRFHEWVLKNC